MQSSGGAEPGPWMCNVTTRAPELAIDLIENESIRILELGRSKDLSEPVPHLGRWKARDVIAHLGGVHRWATRVLTERSMAGPGFKKSSLDGPALCDWFEEGAASLVATMRADGPEAVCPNFNPGSPSTVAWWIRRQQHETTIHRWDVEAAFGAVSSIDPSIAVDGIDEFLDTFVRTRGKHDLDSTVLVETTRPKRRWTLRPADKPGRIDVSVGPPASGESEVTLVKGRPDALLLALWGRLTAPEAKLAIEGRAELSSLLKGVSGD